VSEKCTVKKCKLNKTAFITGCFDVDIIFILKINKVTIA
jgi:hypothetical protein